MSYASGSWSYRDPLTTQKLNQMIENTVRTSQHRVWGCEITVNSATSTVNVAGGSLELEGAWLTRDANAGLTGLVLTATTSGHWIGEDQNYTGTTGHEIYYVYAYNDSGNSFACKLHTSAPAYSDTNSATANGPKIYDKMTGVWYRCVGAVKTFASGSALSHQREAGNMAFYIDTIGQPYYNNAQTATWTLLQLTGMPTFSQKAMFGVDVNNGGADHTIFFRPNLSGSSAFTHVKAREAGVPYHHIDVPTNSAQEIQWYDVPNNYALSVRLEGYDLGRLKGIR